ncbi:MAG: hypothetical protein ACI4RP_02845 [Acutalibacteraceae bacterium]
MKRNTIIKIFLDVAMLVLYLLLMFATGLGGFFHETVGLGICILFVIHFLLNLSMTKGLIHSATRSGAKASKVILLMMDIVLLIGMPIVIVSGVMMAKDLFVVDTGLPWELIFNLHNILSYVCLGAMLIHLLLHAKYLIAVCKKLPSALGGKEMKSALCRFGAGTAAGIVLYCSLSVGNAFYNGSQKVDTIINDTQADTQSELPSETVITHDNTIPAPDSEITDSTISDSEQDTVITEDETQGTVEDEPTIAPTQPETQGDTPPSLEDYLSKLNCTACGRHCSLLYPRCGRGQMQAQQAEEEYNQTYYSA